MIFRIPSPAPDYLSFLYTEWKKPVNKKDRKKQHKWRNKGIKQK